MAGGGIPPYLQKFLLGSISGDPTVWLVDLGNTHKDRDEPQRIPPQGGPLSGRNASKLVHSRRW